MRAQAKLEEEGAGVGDIDMRGVGAAHKRHRKHKGSEEPRAKKLKGDEATEMPLVGGGSKQTGGERKTKLVTRRLSQELLEYLRTKEVMGFIATEMPRPLRPNISGVFGQKLKEKIAAQFEENKEFDSYVLYQYRTKGHAEIQEEVDEEEVEEGDEVVEIKVGEAMKLKGVVGAGAGSKEKSAKRSPLLLENVLIDELITYMVSEPLRVFVEDHFSDVVFDTYLDARISASYERERGFNASVIQQYRMNGYADFQPAVNNGKEANHELEELTYELEELTYELEEAC